MKNRNIAISALFAAIICILSPISIQCGTIPFSLGLLAIIINSLCQRPAYAFASVMAYVLLGAVGIPVFAGFIGGFERIIGPTGGFIISYPFIALLISFINTKCGFNRILCSAIAGITGFILCYAFGTAYFCISLDQSFANGLAVCVVPFIAFDILKLIIAIALSFPINRAKKQFYN